MSGLFSARFPYKRITLVDPVGRNYARVKALMARPTQLFSRMRRA